MKPPFIETATIGISLTPTNLAKTLLLVLTGICSDVAYAPALLFYRDVGQLVFQSLLISAGLGIGAMSVAASSEGRAGDIARSSGRIALAAFERTVELNRRYELADRFFSGVETAGRRLREFDEEHKVVHRASEGVQEAWRGVREFDDSHQLSTRAGRAVGAGLDKLAQVLDPSAPMGSASTQHAGGGPTWADDDRGGSGRRAGIGDTESRRARMPGATDFMSSAERNRGTRTQASGMSSAGSPRTDGDGDGGGNEWWDRVEEPSGWGN